MFQGSMVALVTPMRTDGSVDRDALKQLVDWHVEQGTNVIVSVGTTGESATLDTEEHADVIAQTVGYAAGRIPVMAGTGSNSTAEAIHLTNAAKKAGADAALLVTPYYNKPTQEGLFQHYKAIAEAVAIPQVLYNVPGRTSVDMLPDTVARLASINNIIGIKEATGDMQRLASLQALCPIEFEIYSGDDATAMEYILAGAHGNISVTANVAPRAMSDMCRFAAAGDRSKAAPIDERLSALNNDLFVESNPIPVKWALAEMGRIPSGMRLPLTPLHSQHHNTIRKALLAASVELKQ